MNKFRNNLVQNYYCVSHSAILHK